MSWRSCIPIPELAQAFGPLRVYLHPGRSGAAHAYVWSSGRAKIPECAAFTEPEQLQAYLERARTQAEAHGARIAARNAEHQAARRADVLKHSSEFNVGAILCASWGYDQTNIDLYEVVARPSLQMVVVRKIAGEYRSTGWEQGVTKPMPGKFIGPELRRRINGHSVTIDDVRRARPTPANSEHFTSSYA